MVYHWAGRQLGGQRRPRADSPHVALDQDGLRGYADYMDTPAFERAALQLARLAAAAPTAIMCAERAPEHCHRALIADYLSTRNVAVCHLISREAWREHSLSEQARRESAHLVYDRFATARLELH